MNSQLVERMLNIPAITADVPMRWEDRSTDKYGLAQIKKTITYSPLPLRAVSQPAQPVQGAGADAVDGAGFAAEGLAEIKDSVPLRIDDHAVKDQLLLRESRYRRSSRAPVGYK